MTWTDHFSKLHSSVPNDKLELINEIKRMLVACCLENGDISLDKETLKTEIIEACKRLKMANHAVLTGFFNEMIKYGKHVLLHRIIVKLFNLILTYCCYPKEWSHGILVSIYTSSGRMDPNNYRGITITSSFCKLFKSILNTRLEGFLKTNNIINDEQTGFKAGSRTSNHIFKLKTLLCKYLRERVNY